MKFLRSLFSREQRPSPALDICGIIIERLRRTGLTNERPQDFDFYIAAYQTGQLFGDKPRKIGMPATAEQKRALSIAYRGVLTVEFLDTLNDLGRADPVQAAWVVSSSTNTAISCAQQLSSLTSTGHYAHFEASNMAAGPCPRAARMNQKRYRPEKALAPPFADCTHPDQCACFYRAALSLRGEF